MSALTSRETMLACYIQLARCRPVPPAGSLQKRPRGPCGGWPVIGWTRARCRPVNALASRPEKQPLGTQTRNLVTKAVDTRSAGVHSLVVKGKGFQ